MCAKYILPIIIYVSGVKNFWMQSSKRLPQKQHWSMSKTRWRPAAERPRSRIIVTTGRNPGRFDHGWFHIAGHIRLPAHICAFGQHQAVDIQITKHSAGLGHLEFVCGDIAFDRAGHDDVEGLNIRQHLG